MKPKDWLTAIVLVGAMILFGLDKLDGDLLLALIGGSVLRSPVEAVITTDE